VKFVGDRVFTSRNSMSFWDVNITVVKGMGKEHGRTSVTNHSAYSDTQLKYERIQRYIGSREYCKQLE
jgi:hypothetical protein